MNLKLLVSLFLTLGVLLGMQGPSGPGWSDLTPFSFPAPLLAAESPPPAAQSSKGSPTYVDVAPIFARSCVRCHSGDKPSDGLRLDSYAGVMAGGWNGPVVVAGDTAKSELIRRIRGKSTPRMPYKGPPWLSEAEMTLLEQWVQKGAPGGDTKKP